jgi:hypothetical protein
MLCLYLIGNTQICNARRGLWDEGAVGSHRRPRLHSCWSGLMLDMLIGAITDAQSYVSRTLHAAHQTGGLHSIANEEYAGTHPGIGTLSVPDCTQVHACLRTGFSAHVGNTDFPTTPATSSM